MTYSEPGSTYFLKRSHDSPKGVALDKPAVKAKAKPEPKPDLKLYFEVAKYTSEKDKPFLFLHRECMNPENNRIDSISQNLRLIFDGETGELKSAEVLK